jgi:hypothetical protein
MTQSAPILEPEFDADDVLAKEYHNLLLPQQRETDF